LDVKTNEEIEKWVWFYYEQGLSVFPVKSTSPPSDENKRPNIPTWKKYIDQRPTKEEIETWLKEGKFQNIAIVLGEVSDNIVALDLDDKDIVPDLELDLDKLMNEKGVWVQATGKEGRYHLITKNNKNPGGTIKDNNVHLEYRANGAYIVVCPSIHPTGKVYHFLNYETPDKLPKLKTTDVKKIFEDMVSQLYKKRGITLKTVEKPPKTEGEMPDCIKLILKGGLKEGQRNDTAFALASWYKHEKKMNPTEIKSLLRDWNKRNKTSISNTEIHNVANSAIKSDREVGCKRLRELNFCPYKDKKECKFLYPEEKGKKKINIKDRTIKIAADGLSLSVLVLGKNKFQINNGSDIVYPTTVGGDKPWYTSEWYRNKIKKTLMEACDIRVKEADKVINDICRQVNKKVNDFMNNGSLLMEDEELQKVLEGIKKVTVIRSEDANIYQVHINERILQLTDKEIYDGPRGFCIQYLNRFLKKIIISNEEWDNVFIPNILSEEKLVPETDIVDSSTCVVTEKFVQFVQNKKVYNWNEIDRRSGYRVSVFFDTEKNVIFVSTDFINRFFESEKIPLTYKISPISWASHLHANSFLIDKRQHGRIGNKVKTFWVFDPEKIMISTDDIEKEQKEEVVNNPVENQPSIEKYSGDKNNL